MNQNDFDLDELLNFDYDRPIAERKSAGRAARNEVRNEKRAENKKAVDYHREQELRKLAQEAAYRRYREEYKGKTPTSKTGRRDVKNSLHKTANKKSNRRNTLPYKAPGKFSKALSTLYILSFIAFIVMMTIMDVLPFAVMVTVYGILFFLSLIIVSQLRKTKIKPWTRRFAGSIAVLLMFFFGMGTAYSIGTLSFFGATTVKNENRVASVTKHPFNVAITGMDVYGDITEPGLSDVNMIVTVNPKTAQVLMTSIPRDYQIYMPDKGLAMDKLTHTGFYGVDTTMAAEEELLDIDINYYVKVNFMTVRTFIDAIGGIDVYSDYEFVPVKREWWEVKKGWNHMSGPEALAFARERKSFMEGDRQRIKNQQAVFEAIIKKAMDSRTMVLNYNKVLSDIKNYVEMSFSSREMRSLAKFQIAKNVKWSICKNSLTGADGNMSTYTAGASYVMIQDPESVENAKMLINAVLNGEKLKKDSDGNVIVEGSENNQETE